jgi:ATP-dependent RNA helicase DDX10/DBP4
MGRGRERDEKRKQQLKARRRAEKHLSKRSTQEAQEIKELQERLAAGAPAPGTNPLAVDAPAPGSYAGARAFDDLPLSRPTREALRAAKFTQLTAIQRAALPHALAGRDVLGAAKTGSGKTLCFLIPVRPRRPRCRKQQRQRRQRQQQRQQQRQRQRRPQQR